jgi:ribosomal protein S18 acetylase RimI-like enzyme
VASIRRARTRADLEAVRALFREYEQSLGIDLDFQGFERELRELPGAYAAPGGRLLLAWVDGEPAGCVGLRALDGHACELKRLYVRPGHRGLGLGRTLVERALVDARRLGYGSVRLDTLPSMSAAKRLYESLGFRPIAPYRFNPVPGTDYLELEL